MMHHPNMHHQVMTGHGHLQNHQGMPAPHQMPPPPHQMHREPRLGMGPSQPGNDMGGGPMGVHGNVHTPHHNPATHLHNSAPHQHNPNMRPAMHMQPPLHQQGKPIRRTYNQNGGMPQQHSQLPPPYPVMAPRIPRPVNQRMQSYQSVQTSHEGNLQQNTLPLTNIQQTTLTLPPPAVPLIATMAAMGNAASEPQETAAVPDTSAVLPSDAGLPTSKEKTPMCLVNELARYNKIKHQYRLTSECGPPHKKIFTVTLRLGDSEEYTAEGSSIKRAQHAAAQKALLQTPHTRPPPKPHAIHLHSSPAHTNKCGSVMPTVELNALAMKRCEPAVYTALPPVVRPSLPGDPVMPPARYPRYARPIMRFNSNYQNRFPNGYNANRDFHQRGGMGMNGVNTNLLYRVELGVGARRYTGEGESPQAARHHAAAQALQDIRRLERDKKPTEATPTTGDEPDVPQNDKHDEEEDTDEVKSPVSLVHELVLRRNLAVTFNVKSERGPPHMKMFTTVCTVGDIVTEAEGNGKKVSKKRAAANMLEELKKKWPPVAFKSSQRHPRQPTAPTNKKKSRNLIKEVPIKESSALGHSEDNGSNPISRLAQLRHAERARSPVYRVVEERRMARRRDFVVECAVDGVTAHGTGPNKKTAKKNAAENALLALGHTPTSPSKTDGETADRANGKSDIRITRTSNVTTSNADGKAVDTTPGGTRGPGGAGVQPGGPAGRQLAPGLLLMQDHNAASDGAAASSSIVACSEAAHTESATSQPKAQLMYLAKLLGFQVEFSNFPKHNHGEYLSLVSLTTEPPVVCHGSADSVEASHQVCARAALHALATMGLHEPHADRPPVAPASSAVLANGISK